MITLRRSTALLAALGTLAVGARAGGVQIADKGHLGTFATIQAAVDAASDGDVLIVGNGSYVPGFTVDGKGLWILALDPASPYPNVHVNGFVAIRNLPPGRAVVLAGLLISSPNQYVYQTTPALEVTNCAGYVAVRQCTIMGGKTSTSSYSNKPPAGQGVLVSGCPGVFLAGCTIEGGAGCTCSGEPPQEGGRGLEGIDSSVALYDCTLKGGRGGEEGAPQGGRGGDACHVTNWGVFMSGSTLTGGTGGGGDYIGCNTSGDGGNALTITDAQAQILDSALIPGAPGNYGCWTGSPGQAIAASGSTVTMLPGARKKMAAHWLSADAAILPLTVAGNSGDELRFTTARGGVFLFQTAFNGVWSVPPPLPSQAAMLGVIPASGVLGIQLQIRNLGGTPAASRFFFQGYCTEASGASWLTGPVQLVTLDRGATPDCNGNGQLDLVDILEGIEPDANHNLIPDSCPGG